MLGLIPLVAELVAELVADLVAGIELSWLAYIWIDPDDFLIG